MAAAPLLSTKLTAPLLHPQMVPRPRLLERLTQGLARTERGFGGRLTLLSAPAGFGKTTLLAEWVEGQRRTEGVRAAWLSLDQGDNDLARFLSYLVAALQTLQAGLGEGLLSALRAPRQAPIEAVLAALLSEAAGLPEPFLLVLDDYHLVQARPIHQATTFLLEHLPPRGHLVIATRVDPPLPLGRLRGRGQLNELRAADLRFTSAEAAALLRQLAGLELASEELSALESRTEGWAAGLQLAALSLVRHRQMHGGQEVAGFIRTFAGDDRYIVDYLVGEVLLGQPEALQRFLLETSLLPRLCAGLCDAVTGQAGSQATLEALERANLFIVPLDQVRSWYRYHSLFADLLRQRLTETRPADIPHLHSRASAWFERHGFAEEAIAHALAGNDFGRAGELIVGSLWAMSSYGQTATVRGWLDALPDELVRSRVRLSLAYAWVLLSSMEVEAIELRLQDAERALQADSRAGERTAEETAALLGEVAALRATVASILGQIAPTIAFARQALDHLPAQDAFLRGIVTDALGVAYEASGEVEAASQAFAESARLCRQAGHALVALIAMANLGRLREVQGRLHQAEQIYRQALQYAAEQGDRPPPVAGLAHVGLGGLQYERNDLEAAERSFREGIRLGRQLANVEIQIVGGAGLARVHQARGDPEGALEAIGQAEQLMQRYHVSAGAAAHALSCRARLWIAQGRLAEMARWVRDVGLGEDHQSEFAQLIRARLLLAQGDPGPAGGLLEPLLRTAEAQGRMGSAIEILVLLASARQAQGDSAPALEALARALALAEGEGYLRTFLDAGPAVAALLRRAAAEGIAPAYVGRLLAAVEEAQGTAGAPGPAAPAHPPLVEPLTERELEVLRGIAAGRSNREIAQELVVTVGTVKWHTHNIYGKLQVQRRTEAVARARELGLL